MIAARAEECGAEIVVAASIDAARKFYERTGARRDAAIGSKVAPGLVAYGHSAVTVADLREAAGRLEPKR